MTKEQEKALNIAIRRFGIERVLEKHKQHQYLIDEWKCELRPLNTLSMKEMEEALD